MNDENLTGALVTHKKFGQGTVVEHGATTIKVQFASVDRIIAFQYPQAIGSYIELADGSSPESPKPEKKTAKPAEKKPRPKNEKIEEPKAEKVQTKTAKPEKTKAEKPAPKSKDETAAPAKTEKKPADKKKPVEAKKAVSDKKPAEKSEDSRAKTKTARPSGKKTRLNISKYGSCMAVKEIDKAVLKTKEWRFTLGKEGNGKIRKITSAKPDHICVMTEIPASLKKLAAPERRIIFALFLIKEVITDPVNGDAVTADPKYRLTFTPEQAEKFKFWKYYRNAKNPESFNWGVGRSRFFGDDAAKEALKMAVALKKGTKEEALAKDFQKHYLKLHPESK